MTNPMTALRLNLPPAMAPTTPLDPVEFPPAAAAQHSIHYTAQQKRKHSLLYQTCFLKEKQLLVTLSLIGMKCKVVRSGEASSYAWPSQGLHANRSPTLPATFILHLLNVYPTIGSISRVYPKNIHKHTRNFGRA